MKTKSGMNAALWIFFGVLAAVPTWAQMASTPDPASRSSAPLSEKIVREANAENKFYVKIYGFYGLLAPGGFRGQGAPPQNLDQYSTVRAYNYTSKNPFGTGLRVGGGIGYVINDFINVGVDGEYVLGATTTESYSRTVGGSQDTDDFQLDYSYRIINVIPNITFKAVSKPGYYIYNRLGINIGIPTQLEYLSIYTQNQTGDGYPQVYTEKRTFELEKKIGFGYQAALGVQFRISDNLRGFAEIVSSGLQLKSDKQTITEASYSLVNNTGTNDRDVPVEIDVSARTREGLNLSMPVNSLGISMGIALRF